MHDSQGGIMLGARPVFIGLLGLSIFGAFGGREARADTPTVLVPSGVSQVGYSGNPDTLFSDPGTFWYTQPTCTGSANELSPALILRGTTYAATPREIMRFNPSRAVGVCNPYRLMSNLAADADFIYFVDNQGPSGHFALQKRSRDANPGDASTFLVDLGTNLTGAEVNAQYPTVLFAILHRSGLSDVITEYLKDDGAVLSNGFETGAANAIRDMQYDGRFLYWINGSELRADDTTNGAKQTIVPSGVTSYFAEGFYNGSVVCSPLGCDDDLAFVLYGKGNQVLLTETFFGGGYPPYYTSTDPNATITYITRDNLDNVYHFERRAAVPGGVFDREDRLYRNSTLIYGPINNGGPGFDGFTTDLSFLFFHNRVANNLLRLPKSAAAVPIYDLRGTGIEITQGIQNPENSISLYSGRRTFVRFYAKSFGATDAAGVTATLNVFGFDGVFLGRLEPINRVGKLLKVLKAPKRINIDDSFLFELPLPWTQQPYLQFQATVNPLAGVVEDNFQDNSATSPILILSESPRMDLEIVDFRYQYGPNLVTGGFSENYDAFDYMNRVYPLAVGGGVVGDPRPGLHRNINVVQDDGMASRVDRSHADCKPLLVLNDDKTVKSDDRNQCAGNFALATIQAMRAAGDIPKNRYYYGAIAFNAAAVPVSANCPDGKGKPGQCLTRGFNPDGESIAVGPRLDFSGSQQNYMSHEIGHALGRGHPSTGADPVCGGQSAGDPSFPNPLGRIGNALITQINETTDMGFDAGQAGNPAQPMMLRTATAHGDFMTYCPPHWTSAYTYAALWTKLSFFPLPAAGLPRAAGAPVAAGIPGDWLLAFGNFSVGSQAGSFSSVRRLAEVAEVPPLVAGGYAFELRNGAGALLESHEFTPAVTDEASPELRSFGLVVPFALGTRSIRIVDIATAKVLVSRAVSANPPVVSDVALVGAPDPVTGIVDLTWTASDPDGDPLHYAVFYSHDGGDSWRPLQLSLTETSLNLDTDALALGGGTGVLRVEANDGAQSGRADSQPFTVEPKAPKPRIQSPAGEIQIQWGQFVNFIGQAEDPQQQPILDEKFVWSNPYRILGTGPTLGVTDLEVGSYDVTLNVTNAAGLAAFTQVPVVVGDRIPLPGPRLSATPASIAFSVDADETTIQTATIDVMNVGGAGSLPLTATSSPSWIQVNGATDIASNAPVVLDVTADPSGLPAGVASMGEIVLTHTGDPTDTITISVTLAKGQVFVGVPPIDSDADGVPDTADDCLLVADADQRDTDGDGYGNACDPDFNNDLVVNANDLARLKSVFFKADALADLNGDGVVNAVDLARLKANFFKPPGPSALVP
jgi:hypothetical protein